LLEIVGDWSPCMHSHDEQVDGPIDGSHGDTSPRCSKCLPRGQVQGAIGFRTEHPAGQGEQLRRVGRQAVRLPILEDLREEYRGRFEVVFIDVWKDPEAGKAHRIRMIPTQIFFDASGKELYRHEGFFSKEDILAKWKELEVDLENKPAGAE